MSLTTEDTSLPFAPVLVAGAPRSGTHFLHALICTSTKTNPFIPESHYLHRLVSAYTEASPRLTIISDSTFSTAESFEAHHFRYVRDTIKKSWQNVGEPPFFTFKHCALTPLIRLLGAHIPNMRFVVIVRDPRDAIASIVRAVRRRTGQSDLLPMELIEKGIDLFNAYYGSIILAAGDTDFAPRLLCIRYEDLALARDLHRLREFLGFDDIDPARLWQRANFDIALSYKNFDLYSDLWGKPLSAVNIGRYSEVLAPEISEIIRERTQDVAEIFYTLTGGADLGRVDKGDSQRG